MSNGRRNPNPLERFTGPALRREARALPVPPQVDPEKAAQLRIRKQRWDRISELGIKNGTHIHADAKKYYAVSVQKNGLLFCRELREGQQHTRDDIDPLDLEKSGGLIRRKM